MGGISSAAVAKRVFSAAISNGRIALFPYTTMQTSVSRYAGKDRWANKCRRRRRRRRLF